MAETRLTREQCQEIADSTMRSLDRLGAAEALARLKVGERHVDEVVTDETTGKSFRRMILARPIGESDVLHRRWQAAAEARDEAVVAGLR